jgi:Protein of unknown function (DUF3089)
MRKSVFLAVIVFVSCSKTYYPQGAFSPTSKHELDYSNIEFWAAHPDKVDLSDNTPEGLNHWTRPEVDVFYLYPTSYTGDKGETKWNADIDDKKVNKKTDDLAIKYQASAWNHAGKVYAPYYRQAHINAYWNDDKASAIKAFDFAYGDVKNAFEYYLKNQNHGRPIILASHSQGSTHMERLIKDFFDGKELQSRLVAAYLLGMPVLESSFTHLKPCEVADDVECYVSWRTFKSGHYPFKNVTSDVVVTNPLSWKRDTTAINKSENQGSIFYKFKDIKVANVGAQVHKDILWSDRPKFRGSRLLRTKNYHPGDVNLYYISIRSNAKLRAEKYLETIKK